jgi:endonuclease G
MRPYAEGSGYDPMFLGLPLPMPTVDATTVELPYRHVTVLPRPDRRLAALTAVNIHGELLLDVDRDADSWTLDWRVAADQHWREPTVRAQLAGPRW